MGEGREQAWVSQASHQGSVTSHEPQLLLWNPLWAWNPHGHISCGLRPASD